MGMWKHDLLVIGHRHAETLDLLVILSHGRMWKHIACWLLGRGVETRRMSVG